MSQTILISAIAALLQLSDSYLRWCAFSNELTRKKTTLLWINLFGWSAASFVIYFLIFQQYGIGAVEYKGILMIGWIPYLAISVYIIGGEIFRHVFIFGMSALWSFLQHNWSSWIVVAFFVEGKTDAEIIITHAAFYLILFVALLPLEKYLFTRLLPPKDFFLARRQSIYLSFLPPIIILAHIIRLADNVLVHSWEERFSRIYLPFVFLFFYRYILTSTKLFYRQKILERLNFRLKSKLFTLKEYNKFMQESRQKISVMRHDLRHSYRLIYTLLEEGDVDKAREYIITQKLLLESTTVRPFCHSTIINTVLSICLTRAEKYGTEIFQKIDIPDNFKTNENDLALLLTSLLEFSVHTSKLQPPGSRKISIVILRENEQFVLEIITRCNEKPPFDSDALKIFVKKYDAYVDFSQLDDQIKLLIYWKDEI